MYVISILPLRGQKFIMFYSTVQETCKYNLGFVPTHLSAT